MLIAIGSAAASCGASSSPHGGAPTKPPNSVDDEWSPLETLLYGGAERNDKVSVAMKETESCMRLRGWSTYVGSASIVTPLPDKAARDLADATWAYGVTAPDPEPPFDPNAGWLGQLSPPEQERFSADLWQTQQGEIGCMKVGSKVAFGNLAIASPEIGSVVEEVESRIASSADYQELLTEWNECIVGLGYNYSSPDAILADLGQQKSDIEGRLGRPAGPGDVSWSSLSQLEHRLYDADLECRTSIRYADRLFRIRAAIETDVITAHPGLLTFEGK